MTLHRIVALFTLTLLVTFCCTGKVNADSIQPQVVNPLTQDEPVVQQQRQVVTKKAIKLNNTSSDVKNLQAKKQALAQQLADEQKAIDDLKQQIATKKAVEAVQASQAVAPQVQQVQARPVGETVSGCGDNSYANFIYMHESGCRTGAQNAGGCLGIGQACPGSKLLAVCPNLDYACENAFFTNYANKYGGWAGAYDFWQANGWW